MGGGREGSEVGGQRGHGRGGAVGGRRLFASTPRATTPHASTPHASTSSPDATKASRAASGYQHLGTH
jgi:hypothetical protein